MLPYHHVTESGPVTELEVRHYLLSLCPWRLVYHSHLTLIPRFKGFQATPATVSERWKVGEEVPRS